MQRPLILILCFFSGFSALVCELVWTRMMIPVFGNTVFAASMAAGIFMAGIGLGGWAGGRWGGRLQSRRQTFFTYAVIEAAIGLFALCFPLFNTWVSPLQLWLARATAGSLFLSNLVRLTLFALLLLPPTTLMGATFPMLGVLYVPNTQGAGRGAALVYGWNTLGGMAGVLAAGFFLIRILGGRQTLCVASGVDLIIALLSGAVARFGKRSDGPLPSFEKQAPSKSSSESEIPPHTVRLLLVGAALAGFCALSYEVIWTRLLVLVMQNSVYAFSLILAGFLAGIGLGSLFLAPFLRQKTSPALLFGAFQVLTGLACWLVPFGFSLPERPGDISYLMFLLAKPAFLVAAPMAFSGALVPLVAAAVCRGGTSVGRSFGAVYAANTLGSVAGALSAGFALLPLLGSRRALLLLFGLQVLYGALVLVTLLKKSPHRIAAMTAVGIAVAFGIWGMPAGRIQQLYGNGPEAGPLLFFAEGRAATAAITLDAAGHRILSLNGIPEVTNDRPAMRTFRLMALLPWLSHPAPDDALMITFGAGISAGMAVHLYDRVDCVELNETCKDIARIYRRENRDVLAAENLHLAINDGRNYLLRTQKTYSAVICDATHPHSYDSWILFTREFYRLCRNRLDDHGLFCQWLPLHGLAPAQFRIILNTVRTVLPEATLWVVDRSYCLIVAGKTPLHLPPRRLASALNREDLRPFLRPMGLDNPYEILGCFVSGRKGLDRLLNSETRVNTDDHPHNQFFPLSATGFDRMRWPMKNLRQLSRYRESVSPLFNPERR